MQEIMVSILCLAYNHEKYIRKTLESVISQKTNFRFEVIVHDDASTDGTTEIIREFEQKYPDIFKPIYQTENQYYNSPSLYTSYIIPKAQGKYCAICECDDFWIDENKTHDDKNNRCQKIQNH
jgi:glycosyltransferase involved in cell wall biosynthesis